MQFADSMPWLLINRASVDDLSHRLGSPVPAQRFRPNIVIAGAPAYAEDTWETVEIGEVTFPALLPCDRCTVVTVDDEDRSGPEPLRTLAQYRRVRNEVMFGQRMIHSTGGVIRVGDALKVGRQRTPGELPTAVR